MPAHNSAARRFLPLTVLLLPLVVMPLLRAQETQESTSAASAAPSESASKSEESSATPSAPLHIGSYNLSGSGSFGYRFVDVGGSQAQYNELLNLQQGPRLFSADFALQSPEVGKGWFDRLWVTAQGLGGDPFPSIRADIRKMDSYELRVGYRATQYFFDLPQTSFTSNRAWLDRRRFADADLRYSPLRNLSLRFFFNRTERAGSDIASSPFFYVPLGVGVWEALGHFGATSWVTPLREEANLYGAGLDYRVANFGIHIDQSYRTYNNPANLQGFAGQPILLNGPLSPSQNLVLNRWDTLAAFNIPTTTLFIEHEIQSRSRIRFGYVHSHASGPTSLDGQLSQPGLFLLNYTGAGTTKLTTDTVEAGFTFIVFKRAELISDYRYQTYGERGVQTLQAQRSDIPLTVALANDTLRWDFGIHTLDSAVSFNPSQQLSVRAGLRFVKQDIVRTVDGQTTIGTRRTWSYTPLINAAWTPNTKFSLRGDFESRVTVDPYVRISPETSVGSKIRTRYSPNSKWGIDNTFSFRNASTQDLNFLAHARSNFTSLWYQPVSRIGFQGGYTYTNFYSKNSIAFLQGVPPLNGLFSEDQTIDRIITMGLNLNATSALTVGFTGQYIRSTGTGTIPGTPTIYGPLTWPAWSAEIGYNTKHFGRVVFGWQRSYYNEDLFHPVDYSANGFTLRFERAF